MKYTIVVTRQMAMYTAYEGMSYVAANKASDMVRSILILTGGTATISARYDGGMLYPIWDVTDGQASPKIALRHNVVIA